MEEFKEIEIIDEIPKDSNDFKKFLRNVGINEKLEDVTLNHTKNRLEFLLALAEEGKDEKLTKNKKILKTLLEKLKGQKEKRAEMKALREIYREYENISADLYGNEEKELNKKIKNSLKQLKKYQSFKKHEEKIAEKWIKELNKDII